MFLTVAICTRNRSALLRQTLERMTALTPLGESGRWELLVVDNGSSDDTSEVVAAFASRLPIRIVAEPAAGLSHARNRAVREAAGEYILWTDDDVLAEADWLVAFAGAVQRFPGADVFGGVVLPWFAVEPDPDYLEAFTHLKSGFCGVDYAMAEGLLEPPASVVGANMAFRRKALLGVPFDPTLGFQPDSLVGGEEGDVVAKIRARGGQVIWCPAMRVRHYVPADRMELDYILPYYEGRGRVSVRLLGPPTGRRLAGVPLWVVRRAMESKLEVWWARIRGQRIRSLKALALHFQLRGVVKQCLASR